MVTPERVEAVIARLRPLLRSDGGDIELVDVTDNRARVRFTGNCVGCPSASITLHVGLEWALKEEMPDLEELIVV
jgi:Fe-S cluster biogenesis protein NfuA